VSTVVFRLHLAALPETPLIFDDRRESEYCPAVHARYQAEHSRAGQRRRRHHNELAEASGNWPKSKSFNRLSNDDACAPSIALAA
jgi:hypothetical protein